MTWIIAVGLLAVLAALASAGLFMLRKKKGDAAPGTADKRMARALAARVAISITLFLLIMLAWKMGWIAPKGIPTGR